MADQPDVAIQAFRAKNLLWIDCIGGLVVGPLVLMFSTWPSEFYTLPVGLLIVMGMTNLAYGTFSLSLARRRVRPRALVAFLAIANVLWGALCAATAAVVAKHASALGLAHLLLESAYVGSLGVLEWKYRASLATAGGATSPRG